jgi:hypothetical protein
VQHPLGAADAHLEHGDARAAAELVGLGQRDGPGGDHRTGRQLHDGRLRALPDGGGPAALRMMVVSWRSERAMLPRQGWACWPDLALSLDSGQSAPTPVRACGVPLLRHTVRELSEGQVEKPQRHT